MRWHVTALTLAIGAAIALRVALLDQTPPGLIFDEAANVIDGMRALEERPRVYFPSNQGREALHIYAVALTGLVVPHGDLSVRVPSVIVGILTVIAVYFLGREIGGERLGLLATILLGASLPHLMMSRFGFRAIWVPLAITVALTLLLVAIRTGRARAYLGAGAVVGMSLYTYLAARFIPIAVGAVVLHAVAMGRLAPWRPALLLAGSTGLIAAPLGLYFLRNPQYFLQRAGALIGDVPTSERIINALALFVLRGDLDPQHNLPGRAVFDPISAVLFCIGAGLCLARWRSVPHIALIITTSVLVLPQALATANAHMLRAIGVLPTACVIAALGFDHMLGRVSSARARSAAVATLALIWYAWAAYDYFWLWSPSRAAYDAMDGWGRDVVSLVRTHDQYRPLAAASRIYRDTPVGFLGASVRPETVFDGNHAVAAAPGGTVLVLGRPSEVADPIRTRLGEPLAIVDRWSDQAPRDAPGLYAATDATFATRAPIDATFGGAARAIGYTLPPSARPGELILPEVSWTPVRPGPPGTYQFGHLVSLEPDGREVFHTGISFVAVAAPTWQPGARVLTWFRLTLPPDLPEGTYWVSTGFYVDPGITTGFEVDPRIARLPMVDGLGRPSGDRVLLGPLKVWSGETTPPPIVPRATFEGDLRIATVEVPASARAGDSLPVRVTWWAGATPTSDLNVFLHLLDAGRQWRAGADGPPAGGRNPTNAWQPGEAIVDERILAIPSGTPPGRYEIGYGLYELASGRRLPLVSGAERVGDMAILGAIEVVP